MLQIALALAVPVAVLLLLIFATWSVLMHAYDLTHVPLLACSLVPLAAAVAVPVVLGETGPFDPADPDSVTALVAAIALVALSAIVEVVGHEIVGFDHTVRALRRGGRAARRRPTR